MNEREAWLHLAKLWDQPRSKPGGPQVQLVDDYYIPRCLCACIAILKKQFKITKKIYDKMLDKIGKFEQGEYLFPLTLKGAESRATFCRKQAEMLKP